MSQIESDLFCSSVETDKFSSSSYRNFIEEFLHGFRIGSRISASEHLKRMFTWFNTKQGHDYWSGVHTILIKNEDWTYEEQRQVLEAVGIIRDHARVIGILEEPNENGFTSLLMTNEQFCRSNAEQQRQIREFTSTLRKLISTFPLWSDGQRSEVFHLYGNIDWYNTRQGADEWNELMASLAKTVAISQVATQIEHATGYLRILDDHIQALDREHSYSQPNSIEHITINTTVSTKLPAFTKYTPK